MQLYVRSKQSCKNIKVISYISYIRSNFCWLHWFWCDCHCWPWASGNLKLDGLTCSPPKATMRDTDYKAFESQKKGQQLQHCIVRTNSYQLLEHVFSCSRQLSGQRQRRITVRTFCQPLELWLGYGHQLELNMNELDDDLWWFVDVCVFHVNFNFGV